MTCIIIGEQALAGVLTTALATTHLDSKNYHVPVGVLTSIHAPKGGIILLGGTGVSVPRLLALDWRVIWVGAGEMPAGCEPVPDSWLTLSVGMLINRLWNVNVIDARRIIDVLTGQLAGLGVPLLLLGQQASLISIGVGLRISATRRRVALVDCTGTVFDMVGGRAVSTSGDWEDVKSICVPGLGVGLPFIGVLAEGADTPMLDRIVRQLVRHVDVVVVVDPPAAVIDGWVVGLHAPLIVGGKVSRLGFIRVQHVLASMPHGARVGLWWQASSKRLLARIPSRLPAGVESMGGWVIDGRVQEEIDSTPVSHVVKGNPVRAIVTTLTGWLGFTRQGKR